METLLRALIFAWRWMARKRAVSLGIVLALSLGIGAVTAILSVGYPILYRTLPLPDPSRVAVVFQENPELGISRDSFSPANFEDLRREASGFAGLGALEYVDFALPVDGEGAIRLRGARISQGFLAALGVPLAAGRNFMEVEERPGHGAVAILSQGAWQRVFDGDERILGQALPLEIISPHETRGNAARTFTVVGALRRDFRLPSGEKIDVWVPQTLDPAAIHRDETFLTVLGRLRPGWSLEAAQAQVSAIARRLEQAYPETNTGWGMRLESLEETLTSEVRPAFQLLGLAALFVLLAACVNVVLLTLGLTEHRTRELAVRTALGARQKDQLQQLAVESLVLGLAGGVGGLLLAFWVVRLVQTTAAGGILGLEDARISWPILGAALLLALAASLSVAFFPLVHVRRSGVATVLKGSREVAESRFWRRSQAASGLLVVLEVAAAVVLLCASWSLGDSFFQLSRTESGFVERGVVTCEIALPKTRYLDAQSRRQFFSTTLNELGEQPWVEAAGLIDALPLTDSGGGVSFRVDGSAAVGSEDLQDGSLRAVSHGYFEAMRISVLAGRTFQQDDYGLPQVVVDEAFVRRYWPGQNQVGKTIRLGGTSGPARPRQVIGVVGSVRHYGLAWEGEPTIYVAGLDWPVMNLVVLGRGLDEGSMIGQVRTFLASRDRNLALAMPQAMMQLRYSSLSSPRIRGLLVSLFCGAALLLTILGLISVVGYSVARRRHEIGVRRALGAQDKDVRRLVVKETMAAVAIGILAGGAASVAVSRLLGHHLYGVTEVPLPVFALVALLVGSLAWAGVFWPARKAVSLNPVQVLNRE